MRTLRAVILVCLVGLSGFFVWWLLGASRHVAEAKSHDQKFGSEKGPLKRSDPTATDATKPDLKAQLREVMNNANRPISFFGKVIDQDGKPITGVQIVFEIRYTKEVGPVGIGDTFDYPSVMTGPDGRFALTGAKGALLGLKSLEKVGYEPSPKALNGTYWYWRDKDPYTPDAEKPEIFQMWKKAGAEPLVRKGISSPLRYDGTATIFDLLKGETTSTGDLRVTLERNPREIIYGQRNYEWTFTVESLDGGLIASSDEQMYLAPSEGYQPKITVHMPADASDWTDRKSLTVYLKIHGGKQYGRAEIKVLVGSDRATTPFYITSYINPSGSRNLEYDPAQGLSGRH